MHSNRHAYVSDPGLAMDDEGQDAFHNKHTTRLSRCFAGAKAWMHQLPSWALLPLLAMFSILVLMTIMLPVYFVSFKTATALQHQSFKWPSEGLPSSMPHISVVLNIMALLPEQQVAQAVATVSTTSLINSILVAGVQSIAPQSVLSLNIGAMNIAYRYGDATGNQQFEINLVMDNPLANYPFDTYSFDLEVYAAIVNISDLQVDPVDMGVNASFLPILLSYMPYNPGWWMETEFTDMVTDDAATIGLVIHQTIQRSTYVRVFSLFVVILMWLISLVMLTVALNYLLSDSTEVSYEIPTLAVGLLFAFPMLREVQPNLPGVGLAVDLLGYFFNMLIIAASVVVVMAAVISRHHRRTKHLVAEKRGTAQQARTSLQMQQSTLAGLRGGQSGASKLPFRREAAAEKLQAIFSSRQATMVDNATWQPLVQPGLELTAGTDTAGSSEAAAEGERAQGSDSRKAAYLNPTYTR